MRRKSIIPATGGVVLGLSLVFTIGALFPPTGLIEVQSHTLEVDDSHYRVVGTIEVKGECVSWAGVRVTFYGPRYEINGSTHIRRETGYQYFAHMFEGDTHDFSVEFSGAFELHRYRVWAMSGDEKWCELIRETPIPASDPDPTPPPGMVTPPNPSGIPVLPYQGPGSPPGFTEAMEAVKEKYGDASDPDTLAESEGFVDPVTFIVQDLKAQGMSDDEIVELLEEMGMGWYPETGATWVGRSPTPEEAQSLPPRQYPFKDVTNEEGKS